MSAHCTVRAHQPACWRRLALALALLVALAAPAAAQQVQAIAAIVNDQVISAFDVEQRIRLVIASTRLRDTPENRRRIRGQVLRNLIDETLQLQEAQRAGIKVQGVDVQRAFAGLEQQNKMPAGELVRFLNQAGIARETLERQVTAEIAWGRLIGRRISPTITIGDEEIDETLSRLESSRGTALSRVSEIFLPVDSPNEEPDVLATAQRLVQQLRGGADFGAIARQFSRGASASDGGDIGWLQPGQLAPRLDQALAEMQPGNVSEPIRATGGYYIVQLADRRRPGVADPMQVTLTLKQLILPGPTDDAAKAEARQRAAELGGQIAGCDGMASAARGIEGAQVVELGEVKLGEMPERIRAAVADLQAGQVSAPLEAGANLMLLAVCQRDAPDVQAPSRDTVAEQLRRQRAALLAHRYLRDLRRAAVVELR